MLVNFSVAVAMVFALGCSGKSENKCDALAKQVCQGQGEAYCSRVEGWLDKQLTGPKGQKLSKSEANKTCSMILGDDAVLAAYRKEAIKGLSGAARSKR